MDSSNHARSDARSKATDPTNEASLARNEERVDVAVIGGGQAGLAIGYFLARQGRNFVILEAADAVGSAWRQRWDSLLLFTPRRFDALPGADFPGDPDGYPDRDEVVSYLEEYAATFALPVRCGAAARSLKATEDGFVIGLDEGSVKAKQVVVATGPFQTPRVPAMAEGLAPDLFQIHSSDYRNPDGIPEGRLLVVGGGNTGYQIAKELSATRSVTLAIGTRQTPLPQRLFGRDLFVWLTRFGIMKKTVDSRIGRKASSKDTLIGSTARELKRKYEVDLVGRVVGCTDREVTLADGKTLEVDGVIWATGYGVDYSWIDLPIFDLTGKLRHKRGVTEDLGLYFLGLPWQHTRGSALLGWVKDDAKFIADRIAAFIDTDPGDEPAATSIDLTSPQTVDSKQGV